MTRSSVDYPDAGPLLVAATPFFGHLGIDYESVSQTQAVARMPDDPALGNHVGTQHACAIFTVAEAASGGAFVGALADHMAGIRFVARGGEVRYLKPARGELRAVGRLAESPEEILARLEAEGRIDVRGEVEVLDAEGTKVAETSFTYHVRPGAPTAPREPNEIGTQ